MNAEAVRILHLSDLHFGASESLDVDIKVRLGRVDDFPTTQRHLEEFLCQADMPLNLILITGDLTVYGRESGLQQFAGFVDRLQERGVFPPDSCILVSPGNHDVVRPSDPLRRTGDRARYQRFVKIIGSRFPHPWLCGVYEPQYSSLASQTHTKRLRTPPQPCYVFDEQRGIFIYILNTTRYCGVRERLPSAIDRQLDWSNLSKDAKKEIGEYTLWDAGFAGYEQLYELAALCRHLEREHGAVFARSLKICMCHHPLFPLIGEQTEVKRGHVLIDSGQVLRCLLSWGFDVVLHGHKHFESESFLGTMGDAKSLRVISCGTIGGAGDRSFNLLTLTENKLTRQSIPVAELLRNPTEVLRQAKVVDEWQRQSARERVWPTDDFVIVGAHSIADAYSSLSDLFCSGPEGERNGRKTIHNLLVSIDSVFEGPLPESMNKTEDAIRVEELARELLEPMPQSLFYSHAERQCAWHCAAPEVKGDPEAALKAVIGELAEYPASRRATLTIGRTAGPEILRATETIRETYPRIAFLTVHFRYSAGGELLTTAMWRSQELSLFFLINALEVRDLIQRVAQGLKVPRNRYGRAVMFSAMATWDEEFVIPKKSQLDFLPESEIGDMVKEILTHTGRYPVQAAKLVEGLREKVAHAQRFNFFDPRVVAKISNRISFCEKEFLTIEEERGRAEAIRRLLDSFNDGMVGLLRAKASIPRDESGIGRQISQLGECVSEIQKVLATSS